MELRRNMKTIKSNEERFEGKENGSSCSNRRRQSRNRLWLESQEKTRKFEKGDRRSVLLHGFEDLPKWV